jgi:hypothetical protein
VYKIIGDNNKVNYGCIDEPIEWNFKDFKLLDFFGKEIKGLKKKFAYHKFNYIGVSAGKYMFGFAAVNLGYAYNVFTFLYEQKKGMIFSYDKKSPIKGKKFSFPDNPDEYLMEYKTKKDELTVIKSHKDKKLEIRGNFGQKFLFEADFKFSIEDNQPLRVLNPSQPTRWTYTEKFSPLRPENLAVYFDGQQLDMPKHHAIAIYDWSGGYLRRETNWYWASMGGILEDETAVGANFAALVNETYYSENAFWIDNQRTRVPRLIFDFDNADPYKPWHIYSEDGLVDLTFTPEDERNDKVNLGPLGKSTFRQFLGEFKGFYSPDGTEKARVDVSGIRGFCEIHRAIW